MEIHTLLILTTLFVISQGLALHKSNVVKKSNVRIDMTWDEALEEAIRVLELYPLVDGHNDLPWVYRARLENDIEQVNLTQDVNEQWSSEWNPSHTDIPRIREGRLGAQFWSVYMSCANQYKDAVRATLEQIDVARRMIERYSDDFEFVTTADGIEEAFENGKIGGMMGIEGGHQLDSSLAALRMFYELGVRYVTLTHSCTTPWADASPEDDNETPTHNGLTDWGRLAVLEMNRIGMLVDLAHVSKPTMLDTLEVTEAPVIFSHSSAYAVCNHHRNVQDDVLEKVRDNGGIVMVTFVGSYLQCFPSEDKALNVSLVADHIDHIVDVAGIDHVGIGGDYDGFTGVPEGLEDVSKYPNLFAELVLRGWSEEDRKKLAGENLVRVFREVEAVKNQKAAAGETAINDWISWDDLGNADTSCRVGGPQTDAAPLAHDVMSMFTLASLAILYMVL